MSEVTKGYVSLNGHRYPAEQKPPDGNFRKRSTRYWVFGKPSEWCKDDHDLFTPFTYAYGVRTDIQNPRLEITRTPVLEYRKGRHMTEVFSNIRFAQKTVDKIWLPTFDEALAVLRKAVDDRAKWLESQAADARRKAAELATPEMMTEASYFVSIAHRGH